MVFGNLIAVLVAATANMALGAFWYSPAGLGKPWIKLSGFEGKDMEKMKEKGKKAYPVAFLQSLVLAAVLSVFVVAAPSLVWAAKIGLVLWVGFVATTMLNPVLWSEQPLQLYAINSTYHLVGIILMSLILVGWPA